jgi:phosphatidylglycerol:prolipoprotein diacylglycerol transferase
MYPILFSFEIPEFLQGFLPPILTVYAYGFMIATGIVVALAYTVVQAKRQFGVAPHLLVDLALFLMLAAFIGGKVFFYLEDPATYLGNPSLMFKNLGKGFVFYGSLLFCIPTLLWFFKKHKLPVAGMLDIFAVTTCLVHAFGRVGCFMAGCCFGLPSDGPLAVIFTDPACLARPLDTPLHPTQLYDMFAIISIMLVLLVVKQKRQFSGQVFLVYLGLYAVSRSIVEIFRGDEQRGFIINNLLSHSQFIALLILAGVVYYYLKLLKQSKARKGKKNKAA